MISWMQKHRKYLVVTIWISTIAFVGAGFVGWGAYSYNQDKANSVATVGDEEITLKELQSAYTNLYSYYNQMLGGQLTKEKAEELHLQDIALNQLIEQALLLNYAKAHGIVALKEEIIARLQSIEAFQENGVFSKNRYFQVLKSIGTDAKSFENGLEKEIIIDKLTRLLHLPPAALEAKTLFASAFMEDKIAVRTIEAKPEDINISEEELKTYWENNKEKYLSKKSYDLEVIEIDATAISVSDADLESYYSEHKTRFKDKEDKILPFDKAKDAVRLQVQKKKAKTEALKKYLALKNGKISADKNITVTEGSSDIPLEKIRKAKAGAYIKTIELPKGYMTARLIAVNMPQPLAFEKAKEMAKADLLAKKMQTYLAERAKEALKNPKAFREIGFISREDTAKLDFLAPDEAGYFVSQLFGAQKKEGYVLFEKKAVAYQILDQRLFDQARFDKQKKRLMESAETLKQNSTQRALIESLQKQYKIEKHYKG